MRDRGFHTYRRPGGFGIGPGFLTPFIKIILISNAALFLISIFYTKIIYLLGLNPALFFNDFPNWLFQPFTYMFLHGGFGHIFWNMFMLWMFGTEIEATWGSRNFGKFYIISGIAGAVLSLIVHPGQNIPIVGASGAIWGVMAAYWIMFPNRYLYLWFLFPIKVKWAIPGFLILGLIFELSSRGGNIAHMAHLGGALYGIAYLKLDWRIFAWGKKLKNLKYKRQAAKLEKNRQQAEDIMKRVDDILDKINEVGIENISKADRKFLEEASSRLSKKKTE